MSAFRIAAASTLVLLALSVPAGAETMAPTALNSLTAAPNVAAAQVMDQHGRVIGTAPRIQPCFFRADPPRTKLRHVSNSSCWSTKST